MTTVDVDLQRIAEAALGPGKQSGRAVLYRAPWRSDDDTPSFAVYANGYKDFGGSGEYGDPLEFVKRHYGLQNRREAADFLRDRGYDLPAANARPGASWRRESSESDAPPAATWQALAAGIADRAAAYLWSGRDDANAALSYLRGRGLTDDTIRAAGLGFNRKPQDIETTPGEKLTTLAAGVTIPIRVAGVMFALKVNAVSGAAKLAAELGQQTRQGAPKYVYLTGSRQKAGAFLPQGGELPDGLPVLIVEGEFDAMIAQQQIGGGAAVMTLGSATNTPARRWRDMLRGRRVYIALDNDKAGKEAAAKLAAALSGQIIPLPSGVKDANEYHLAGGSLLSWWCASIDSLEKGRDGQDESTAKDSKSQRQTTGAGEDTSAEVKRDASRAGHAALGDGLYFAQGVPDTIRRALTLYAGKGAAHVYELWTCAVQSGQTDPRESVTRASLAAAALALGWGCTDKTIRSGFDALREFLTQMNYIERKYIRSFGAENTPLRGRPSAYLTMPGVDLLRDMLTGAATWAIHRETFDADGLTPVLPALALEPLYADPESAAAAAAALEHETAPAVRAQPGYRQTHERAQQRLRWFIKSLSWGKSSAIPAGWTLATADDYLVALTRAYALAGKLTTGHGGISRAARIVGMSKGAAVEFLKRAGVSVQRGELVEVQIHDAGELDTLVSETVKQTGGAPTWMISRQDAGDNGFYVRYSRSTAAAFVNAELTAGRSVTVAINPPAQLEVNDVDDPEAFRAELETERLKAKQTTDGETTDGEATDSETPDGGMKTEDVADPNEPAAYPVKWVIKSIRAALTLAGWRDATTLYEGGELERWRSPDGELITGDILTIIDRLVGHRLNRRRDLLIEYIRRDHELGATIEALEGVS